MTYNQQRNPSQVFIVHGHDDAVKEKTARFIEKLEFEAIILHEQASGGKTIDDQYHALVPMTLDPCLGRT